MKEMLFKNLAQRIANTWFKTIPNFVPVSGSLGGISTIPLAKKLENSSFSQTKNFPTNKVQGSVQGLFTCNHTR